MIQYAATIFVSAFLLFQVQPMVARFILPWFGGSSLVWTTCMLFFQTALVFGYAYSHWVTQRLKPRQQCVLHCLLLLLALLTLPVRPDAYWQPADSTMPTLRILVLLTVSVGLPFFLLSTTGPLIQAWQSRTHPQRSPFRLFALSNLASLAALISYPLVFERYMTLETQSWFWSASFALFAVLAFLCGRLLLKHRSRQQLRDELLFEPSAASSEGQPVSWLRVGLWLVLPMLASIQLLATTNLMTQEVGSLPFLWILPLSLYLISFIICFDHERWYVRPVFFALFFASTIFSGLVLEAGVDVPIVVQVVGYSSVCFGAAMCCHGELTRSKPAPEHLTLFYLLVAVGGALGGVFVAVVAPRIFAGFYEFQLGLIAAILFTLVAFGRHVRRSDQTDRPATLRLTGFAITLFFGLLVAFFVIASLGTQWLGDYEKTVLLKTRNEYGILTVRDFENYRKLNNGQIEHGFQFKSDTWRMEPTSYYGPDSGLGLAINYLADEARDRWQTGLDFGVIGLGVGTVCGWCDKDDTIRYFEINPAVLDIAINEFWYLEECKVKPEIVLGDARLQLEREVQREDPRRYDILVADAFSSDSIPVHLLTLESMEIYRQRLKSHGILAVHVSNRFLILENVVRSLARELGMQVVLVDHSPDDDNSLYNSSSWVLVTNNQGFVNHVMESVPEDDRNWPDEKYTTRWTDDFSSIIPVIRLEKDSSWLTELLTEKGWVGKDEGDSPDEGDSQD
jgi:hypothetical protein